MARKCNCCNDIYSEHKNFIRGGVDESDFEPDFRYVRLKKKKPKKFCAKEKENVPCSNFVRQVSWSYYNTFYKRWMIHGYMKCVKCHRKRGYWSDTRY